MEGSAVLDHEAGARRAQRPANAPFIQRFWAFISYSHADRNQARWLHRALERFRVPRAMVGRRASAFLVPQSLTPIFRDQSELAASASLTAEIEEALETSRYLVVLCSPAAVASRWVNEEIRSFRRLRPDGQILPVIVAGEPGAAYGCENYFPPALGDGADPLAIDFRPGGDGRELGLLKLVAGMLDLRLDELVRRDDVRTRRRLVGISAASVAGMVLAIGLTVTAIQARDSAREQRREAESLIGFMIGDLRDRLEPVGRLDALDAVGGRVLAYYERQDKGQLSDDALSQRSRALVLIGEIAQRRGDLDGALRRYREGFAGTQEALRRDPTNPRRMFDHAQNIFWTGSIAWQRGERDEAARNFAAYRALADTMVRADPSNPQWRLEAISADTNLGIVELERRHYAAARQSLGRSLEAVERLIASDPANRQYRSQQIEILAYHSDALERAGRLDAAIAERNRQLSLLRGATITNPSDTDRLRQAMVSSRAMARLMQSRGRPDEALRFEERAAGISDLLERTEPRQRVWQENGAWIRLDHAALLLEQGRTDEAEVPLERGCGSAAALAAKDRTIPAWQALQRHCLNLRSRLALAQGRKSEALVLAGQALAAARDGQVQDPVEQKLLLAEAHMLSGDIQSAMGDRQGASRAWAMALDSWPAGIEETPRQVDRHFRILERNGRSGEANHLRSRLAAMGFVSPDS